MQINNNYKVKNNLKDFLLSHFTEIILFIIYCTLGIMAALKSFNFLFGAFMFGGAGYVFFIIDHKTILTFNKLENTVYIKNKVLFLPIYRLRDFIPLSNIVSANVGMKRCSKDSSILYNVSFSCKDGSTVKPFRSWSTNKAAYEKMVDKINVFLNNNEPVLTLRHSPFLFRLLIGIPFSFFYISGCLYLITPKIGTPLIHFILILFLGQPD